MKFTQVLSVSTALVTASGHSIMNKIGNNAQGAGVYLPLTNNPITDVKSNAVVCNGSPNNPMRLSSQKVTVQAGTNITGYWLHELGSTGRDSYADNKVIDSSHKGPVIAYMKKVDDSTKAPSNAAGDGWFKVAHAGLYNGKWAVDDLIAAGGAQSVPIPSCIANGDYLVRFELIALHSAYNMNGAQLYMSCGQITVTGGSGAKSPATVSFPGAYAQNDPGILDQIWVAGRPYPSSYSIPGPAVFTC